MNIYDKDVYSNKIMRAIIVNTDTSMDPKNEGRYQIFIPDTQYVYSSIYVDYLNDTNKKANDDRTKYPWAIPLVEGLEEGNEVYVNNIDNNVLEFVIIGKTVNSKVNNSNAYNEVPITNFSGQDIINLVAPNILHEEVGLSYDAYPDGISEERYGTINGNDNGSLSIGLLQWNGVNAHDVLFNIAMSDRGWTRYWTDKSLSLYKSLVDSTFMGSNEAIKPRGSTDYRHDCDGKTVTQGTAEWNSIYSMLVSDKGKEVQLEMTEEYINGYVSRLKDDYGIKDIALIIYLADIMNQYGMGVNSVINGCIDQAISIDQTTMSIMDKLESFDTWWRNHTTRYLERRDRTKSYITQLYNQGKLTITTDLTGLYVDSNKVGIFAWPLEEPHHVTSARKPRWGRMHYGVDLMAYFTNVYASAAGTCHLRDMPGGGYGNQIMINHHNGYCTLYAHLSEYCVEEGQEVQQGQLIAISGDTGSNGAGSYAPHLHFEISEVETDDIFTYYNYRSVDPLDYLANDWTASDDAFIES